MKTISITLTTDDPDGTGPCVAASAVYLLKVSGPTLVPDMIINKAKLYGKDHFRITVKVSALNDNSDGMLVIKLSDDPKWTVAGSIDNPAWTYSSNDPAYPGMHVFRSTRSLLKNGITEFGFDADFDPGGTVGILTISANLVYLGNDSCDFSPSDNNRTVKVEYYLY